MPIISTLVLAVGVLVAAGPGPVIDAIDPPVNPEPRREEASFTDAIISTQETNTGEFSIGADIDALGSHGPAIKDAAGAPPAVDPTDKAHSFFPVWFTGANCAVEPKIQVHQASTNFYILRQSLCTNFEAPFIYLIFGEDKVLMQDTGNGSIPQIPLAPTVYGIIDQWLAAHNKASIQLIVTHSHSHGDHVALDAQFIGEPNTTVVGKSPAAVQAFFGITSWPTQIVPYDLGGGRIIDVIPLPGHEGSHIALYDRQMGILFTGDSLYPGRLYFPKAQFATYKASIQRLVDFTSTRPVRYVLGTHIEMSNTPGKDFSLGSQSHPDEHPLQLYRSHLLQLNTELQAMGATPVKKVLDEFIINPL